MSKKDMRRTLRELMRIGFTVEKGKKHIKVRTPDGNKTFIASSSPSCKHAHKNLLSDIRRHQEKE